MLLSSLPDQNHFITQKQTRVGMLTLRKVQCDLTETFALIVLDGTVSLSKHFSLKNNVSVNYYLCVYFKILMRVLHSNAQLIEKTLIGIITTV